MLQLLVLAAVALLLYYYSRGAEQKVDDLQEKVNLVSAMFPHIPKAIIQEDLRNGSTVEQTCEKIISGQIVQPIQSNSTDIGNLLTSDQSNSKSFNPQSSSQSKIVFKHLNGPVIESEPLKMWESESEKRQQLLKQRKAYMIQQARLKFLKDD